MEQSILEKQKTSNIIAIIIGTVSLVLGYAQYKQNEETKATVVEERKSKPFQNSNTDKNPEQLSKDTTTININTFVPPNHNTVIEPLNLEKNTQQVEQDKVTLLKTKNTKSEERPTHEKSVSTKETKLEDTEPHTQRSNVPPHIEKSESEHTYQTLKQDIEGMWKGIIFSETDKFTFEIFIELTGSNITGYSKINDNKGHYCIKDIEGSLEANNKIKIKETTPKEQIPVPNTSWKDNDVILTLKQLKLKATDVDKQTGITWNIDLNKQ